MTLRELPQGSGQVVYIDLDAEGCDKNLLTLVIEHLHKYGYIVTSDSRSVGDEAFFFTPCLDKHINKNREDFASKKKAMITDCLANEKVKAPLTISFPENSFPDISPDLLPIVIKNQKENGGKDKFIIRTLEQLQIFKNFYYEINAYDKKKKEESIRLQKGLGEEVVWDENGHSLQTYWSIFFNDYKKNLHEDFVIQKFIKTPTKYNTSLRVVTSSSGEILCASLKYADRTIKENQAFNSAYDKYLSDPSSPYFLGSESIISNTVAGGNSILLGRKSYSELEQEILKAHGIDPNSTVVPPDVVSAASRIAIKGRRLIGAISGMDFIFDEEEKAWKFLEQHEYPMLYTYAEAYGLPYDSMGDNTSSFFKKHFVADIDARLLSLALAMQKRQFFKIKEDSGKTF